MLFYHLINLMFRDNVPTIHTASWPLAATLFEGEIAAGPVPTLFATDPDAAGEAIKDDPIKAHWDCNKLAKVFLAAEEVALKDALAVMKKPR